MPELLLNSQQIYRYASYVCVLLKCVGSIELPYTALLTALYQPPGSTAPNGNFNAAPAALLTSTNVTPKTLRVRMDFLPIITRSLQEILNSTSAHLTETSLQQCFAFINVEPVWSKRDPVSICTSNNGPVHVAASTYPESVERVTTVRLAF